ncbi:MAG: hypothetical protein A2Z88_09685 [Omnitrophica WOR_2 bacterium GWA2_47_8]|nr:MAG: hypothetical protein A2Z88_09685 [Omnitrophica WOR_2 bacterium GWA2_47_8]
MIDLLSAAAAAAIRTVDGLGNHVAIEVQSNQVMHITLKFMPKLSAPMMSVIPIIRLLPYMAGVILSHMAVTVILCGPGSMFTFLHPADSFL